MLSIESRRDGRDAEFVAPKRRNISNSISPPPLVFPHFTPSPGVPPFHPLPWCSPISPPPLVFPHFTPFPGVPPFHPLPWCSPISPPPLVFPHFTPSPGVPPFHPLPWCSPTPTAVNATTATPTRMGICSRLKRANDAVIRF